jgi:hypothetical protein
MALQPVPGQERSSKLPPGARGSGLELMVDEHHPVLRAAGGDAVVAETVRQALARLVTGE